MKRTSTEKTLKADLAKAKETIASQSKQIIVMLKAQLEHDAVLIKLLEQHKIVRTIIIPELIMRRTDHKFAIIRISEFLLNSANLAEKMATLVSPDRKELYLTQADSLKFVADKVFQWSPNEPSEMLQKALKDIDC